jgi:two-component system nitrogen regulation response regulator GlnG
VIPATVAAEAPISIAKPAKSNAIADSDSGNWEELLELEARNMLELGRTDVWNAIIARAESRLILAALANTKGRRIEAATQLGIGRNTITRKIQELGLE